MRTHGGYDCDIAASTTVCRLDPERYLFHIWCQPVFAARPGRLCASVSTWLVSRPAACVGCASHQSSGRFHNKP
ncbi:hypothetical protein CBM2592_B120005 [Cupriavidus taiwanensis]|nr:hypothetical protein CBM2592_B120005 [Cupriavidus taiwanensis]SOY94078.1 hypothetical protein CBM2591_B110004 [Cupriavidus taiwanensis]SOZ69274.1 hypothetical protein CBM2617_B150005 [Cupriavidus taiwanensis]SOZ85718.1 hypothetical protein CBM2618_B150004 [Cupriavidus taiwanensis]SOZ88963.1 hypothetical protein CBM2622_B160004 [Cupriavidus taiwanensis]